jgi:hypothetical protein
MTLLVGFTINSWGVDIPVAPSPRERPVLKCELRLRSTGKVEASDDGKRFTFDVPGAADVKITNISDADVDIGSSLGPFAHLDLKVKDPTGADLETDPIPYLKVPSALLQHEPYILKPGKWLQWYVSLLIMVPEDKRVTGTYKVKAVYTVGNKTYESSWVDVKWPGKK